MSDKSSLLKFQELVENIFHQKMKSVFTSIPAHVLAFDPKTQTAQIQIGILRVDRDGTTHKIPPIIECPVLFTGGNFSLEFQIDEKCEGLAVFSQRCIDGWFETGGVADNPLARFHDITDCFFIPGFRPMPTVLKDFQNNGIRIRNASGSQFAWLKNDGSIVIENGVGHIRMSSDGTVTINGVVIEADGTISAPKTITAEENVIGSGISLNSHIHPGDSGGMTGGPIK